MQRRFAYVTVDFLEAQYTSIVRAREWQLARTLMPNMTRGEVWYLICPGLTMPVVRVRIVAVGVYTPQCSCQVCYTHGEWQPVVHIDGDLPGENLLVSQPGRLLPTDRTMYLWGHKAHWVHQYTQGHCVSATSRRCSYTTSKSGRRATTRPPEDEGQQQ